MVRIVVEKRLQNLKKFGEIAHRMGQKRTIQHLHRGVISAAKKARTRVQRALKEQMAVAPGSYQKYIVANMRFRSNQTAMSATLMASAKGGEITDFKGLKSLSGKGRVAKRANRGKSFPGLVRSGVWNAPRVFQRSFEDGGRFLALIPKSGGGGSSSTMPKAFWTHDERSWQQRGADGRFTKMGSQRWRVRRLRGPAINKELDKGQSLATFMSYAPAELEREIEKRIVSIMKW